MADSYATVFQVIPTESLDGDDVFALLADQVCEWAGDRDTQPPTGPGRTAGRGGSSYEVLADQCEEGRYWRLLWNRPDTDGRPLSWRSDIRLAQAAGLQEVEVTVYVRVVATDPTVPERVSIGTPRLIRVLLERDDLSLSVGGRPLSLATFVDTDAAERFVADDLLSADRELPIVAVSPRVEDNRPYVDRYQMRRFLGIAEVYFLSTASATRLVSDRIGTGLSCYNGALRVWWPGISVDDDPWTHPLWRPAAVESTTDRTIESVFNLTARVSERRVAGAESVWSRVSAASARAREERFREALEGAELVTLAEEVERELQSVKERVEELELDLEFSRDEKEALERVNELLEMRLKEAYAATSQLEREQQPASQATIDTVSDAVREVEGRFVHIRISPVSFRSAERSHFQRPQEVYRAFEVLERLGALMASQGGDADGPLIDRFREESLDYVARESDRTMARWASERRATYDGREYDMQKHLRWGGASRESQNHIRLYFEWEPEGPFWVVGHVGNHPTNTKS